MSTPYFRDINVGDLNLVIKIIKEPSECIRLQINNGEFGLTFKAPIFPMMTCKMDSYGKKVSNLFFRSTADQKKPLTDEQKQEVEDFLAWIKELEDFVFDFMFENRDKLKIVIKKRWQKKLHDDDMDRDKFIEEVLEARSFIFYPDPKEGSDEEPSPVMTLKFSDYLDRKTGKKKETRFIGLNGKEIKWDHLEKMSMTAQPAKVTISNYFLAENLTSGPQMRLNSCVVQNFVRKSKDSAEETLEEMRKGVSPEQLQDFEDGFAALDDEDDAGEGSSSGPVIHNADEVDFLADKPVQYDSESD